MAFFAGTQVRWPPFPKDQGCGVRGTTMCTIEAATAEGKYVAPTHKPCRILVVDDDRMIRQTLRDALEGEGYVIQTAEHGASALPLIESDPPEIIVLDMRMPVMNGWDFADALRNRGITIPILVLTASQNARAWAREIGAADFLAKPCDLLDLLDKMERLHPRR